MDRVRRDACVLPFLARFMRRAALLLLVSLPALAVPPYKYYVLAPEPLTADLAVTSLEPGNTVSVSGTQRSLGAYESAVIPAASLFPGAIISGTAKYTVGSNAAAADLLAPDFFAGTEFVIPHIAGSHKYFVQATGTTANLTIRLGATTNTLQVSPGTAYEIDAGSDNAIAGRISSDQPIVVAHVAYVSDVAQDAYPVPPASTEVVGIRSQQAVIGAVADGTSITVYASDGTSASYSLDAGQKVVVGVGASTAQGAGSSLRIVANQPIAAVQYDDGDGADASGFWPVSTLTYRYALPVNAQYVAVACLQSGVTVTLFKGSSSPESQSCSASGSNPGKVYFGSATSGANVLAESYLHASAPIYVMYEAAATNEEHNLSGAQSAAGPTAPTLNTVLSPTTSNPVSVTGTAGANATVRLYVNGKLQQTAAATGAGAFTFNAELYDGNNVIHAVAVNSADESTPSNVVEVVYNNSISRTQSGTISTNQVWTPGSPATPYVVSSTLTVAAGAKLVLQPGTTLKFASGASLTVNGVLKISGTSALPVSLTSNAVSPGRGSWPGVVLNSTSTGSEISYALIEWATTAVNISNVAATVRNSTIRYFSSNGVYVSGAASVGALVEGNLIDNFNDSGTCTYTAGSSPTLRRNTIQNCQYGLYVQNGSSPMVTGNVITSNGYGVYVDGNFNSVRAQPVITGGNQIFANATNLAALRYSNATGLVLNLTGNWWGSADPTVISGSITDLSDDPAGVTNYPVVDYSGYLNAANGTPVPGNFLNGPLTASTTLTAGTTYDVLGTVTVQAGQTLTIPAGAVLRFHGNAYLLVNGVLDIDGTSTAPVTLKSGRPTPGKGNWTGVQLKTAGSTIDYAVIEWASTGVNVVGVDATIRNSTIRYFSNNGVYVSGSATGVLVEGNLIQGNSTGTSTEYCVYTAASSPTVRNNTMRNCQYGLYVQNGSSPMVTGNVITSNGYGIYVDGNFNSVRAQPVITGGNQIFANATNLAALRYSNATGLVLNATGNWWGSADPTAISGSITDLTDDPASVTNYPVVDYSGYLISATGPAASGNFLNGPLTATSTTLTGGATYDVLGTVAVPVGKTLTIPAGTVLRFHGNAFLFADGVLDIQGTSASPVTLTSGRAGPGRGNWKGLELRAAGSTVDNALIEWASTGVNIVGVAVTVRNSTIRNFSSNGVYVSGPATGALVEGNLIDNSNDQGTCVYTNGSAPTIRNNTVRNCQYALYVQNSSAPTATGNILTSSGYGVYVDGNFAGGTPASPVINNGNQIFGNGTNFAALRYSNATNLVLNATGNWWGSTVPTTISGGITDLTDNYNGPTGFPTVDYSSYLDGPGGAPVPGNYLIGPLTATTTTLTAGATYDVLGHLFVNTGKTLIVPEGVTMRFHAGAFLTVDGTLNIQGTEANNVLLTSGRTPPANDNWRGIYVRATATGVTIDYATIEWTTRAIETVSVDAIITHSTIRRFSGAGIMMSGATMSSTIANNFIDNFTQIGDGINLSSSSPTISENRIHRTNRGIYLSGASNPVIHRNLLQNNKTGLFLFGNNSNSAAAVPQPTINQNDIFGNTVVQMEVNAYGATNPAVINATGNWWGTPTPVMGTQIKVTSGTVASAVNFSSPATGTLTDDMGPPTPPTTITATANSDNQITVSWSGATDDFGIVSYGVERCVGVECTDFTQIASVSTTSFVDTGRTANTTYNYRVRSFDAVPHPSVYSSVATATTLVDGTAPGAPNTLDVAGVSGRQVHLVWTASTDNMAVAVYLIERCQGSGCSNFTVVGTSRKPSFWATGLTVSSAYSFRVRAQDRAANFSPFSNVKSATTTVGGEDCD